LFRESFPGAILEKRGFDFVTEWQKIHSQRFLLAAGLKQCVPETRLSPENFPNLSSIYPDRVLSRLFAAKSSGILSFTQL